MRKLPRRALALLATMPALAGSLVLTAPAAHAVPSCGTDVVAFEVIDDYRLAYGTSGTTTYLCVQAGPVVELVVALYDTTHVVTPGVHTESGSGSCGPRLIHVFDPVELRIDLGYVVGPVSGVCLGINGVWNSLVVQFPVVTGGVDADVWLPAGSAAHFAYCTARVATGIPCSGDVQLL